MALKTETKKKARRQTAYICPVPFSACKGTPDKQRRHTFHFTSEAIRDCQKKYLTSHGYKRLSSREYLTPEGRILVLNKKVVRAMPGKIDRYMGKPLNPVPW